MNDNLDEMNGSDSGRFWRRFNLGLALVLFLIVLLLPTPEGLTPEAQRLLAITVLMGTCWITEAMPIAATSLLPLGLYPLLNILPVGQVSRAYGDPTIFLFLGGFLLALGIERWNLHRRIALHVLSRVGTSPRRIIFGFMLATAMLSMWISNTATVLMMLPIGLALLTTLRDSLEKTSPNEVDKAMRNLSIPLLLSIAYTANATGVSTYVGTPTNMVFRGFWGQQFVPQGYPDVTFAEWMIVFTPMSFVMMAICGVVMTWNLKPLPNADKLTRDFFRTQLQELGKMTTAEKRVGILFAITAMLWVFRESFVIDGRTLVVGWPIMLVNVGGWLGLDWSHLPKNIGDSTIAVFMASLLFVLPGNGPALTRPRLLSWQEAERGIPWGMLLLFGGGFAMADAFWTTELSTWLGGNFAGWIEGHSQLAVTFMVCTLVTTLTEFTSNTATANMLMPVLSAVALQLQMDPRLLLIPATVSASYGFMMPVGTPPNALVIATGKVPVRSMLAYGLLLNILGIICVALFTW
ncbi:MAG TPA: SLC13 family permease, partial [Planctomicrobium sp.]|nr:SLC13 family permease [Planctomicrobium sp.]